MQFVQTFTYADVNAGPIKITDFNNVRLVILRAALTIITPIGTEVITDLLFVPASGPTLTLRKQFPFPRPAAVGYAYDFNQTASATEPNGLFTSGSGEIFVSLTTSGTPPTQGELIVFIYVESGPVA